MPELARLPRDALGVALRPDRSDLVGPRALEDERARAKLVGARACDGSRLAAQHRLVELELLGANEHAVGDDLIARLDPHVVTDDDRVDGDLARAPSRITVAVGATRAASRSSLRFARSSCQIPIPAFATTIPRNSASRQSPKPSSSTPSDEQHDVERCATFARTMLAVERLDAAGTTGPRAASGAAPRPLSGPFAATRRGYTRSTRSQSRADDVEPVGDDDVAAARRRRRTASRQPSPHPDVRRSRSGRRSGRARCPPRMTSGPPPPSSTSAPPAAEQHVPVAAAVEHVVARAAVDPVAAAAADEPVAAPHGPRGSRGTGSRGSATGACR